MRWFLLLIILTLPGALASVSDTVDLMLTKAKAGQEINIIYGSSKDYDDFLAAAIISSQLAEELDPEYHTFPAIISADKVVKGDKKSLIIVGGPCSNSAAGDILKQSCSDWSYRQGESFIRAIPNESTIIVAGTSSKDTIRAAKAMGDFQTSIRLAEEDDVLFTRFINVKEALVQIIDDHRARGELKIVTTDDSADMDTAVEIGKIIATLSGTNSPKIVQMNEVLEPKDSNLILIGGPCANSITEKVSQLKGFNCKDWKFAEGESVIKILENGEKIAILLSGTNAEDTFAITKNLLGFQSNPLFEEGDEVVFNFNPGLTEAWTTIKKDKGEVTIVYGEKSKEGILAQELQKILNITPEQIMVDNEYEGSKHVIVLGGPCINKLAGSLPSGIKCRNWPFSPGEALVQAMPYGDGYAVLIAGTTLADTSQGVMTLTQLNQDHRGDQLVTNSDPQSIPEVRCSGFLCGLRKLVFGSEEAQSLTNKKGVEYVNFLENSNPNENCYECFLDHQAREYVADTIKVLGRRVADDPFEEADRRYILGKITENTKLTCSSIKFYEKKLAEPGLNSYDKLVVAENLLFVTTECLSEQKQREILSLVLKLSTENDYAWRADLYQRLFSLGNVHVDVEPIKIERTLNVPPNPTALVIGRSFIEIDEHDLIGSQVERSVRDWFSFNIDNFPNSPGVSQKKDINYMEGSIIRKIVNASHAPVAALPNALVVGKNLFAEILWYAPDENGVFRFRVLEDKVTYPTSKCYKNVCLLVDTHGISSLVPQAIQKQATVVVGCGDYTGKMEAAFYLAQKGVHVIYPTDRFAGEMIGYVGEGVALGSAPVKNRNGKAIVGDQPIRIDLDEVIVVQTTSQRYPGQYYDAPERYFKSLEEISGVNLDLRIIDTPNIRETYKIIEEAEKIGATVVAVRVGYEEDYPSVRDWLAKSSEHRAILFHSSAYESGYRLLSEFPRQTSWGDARPVFE